MGAANVSGVLACWRHLPDRAHRALLYMAHRSLDRATDEHRARVYYGGREELAHALGVDVPPAPTRGAADAASLAARAARRNAFKVTDKVIARLTEAGAITLVAVPRFGRRAEYQLHLDVVGVPVDKREEDPSGRGAEDPSQRGAEDPSGRGAEDPSGRGAEDPSQRGPKEEQRNHEESVREEDNSPWALTSPGRPTADAQMRSPSLHCCHPLPIGRHASDCQTPNLRALRGAS